MKPPTKEILWEWIDHLHNDINAFYETLDLDSRPLFLQFAFLVKLGELIENLCMTCVRENVSRVEELHAVALTLAELEPVTDQKKAWKTLFTTAIPFVSDVLYSLYVILSPNFQESEKEISLTWLADRVLGKRIRHANPATQRIIRSLVVSGGQSKNFQVLKQEVIFSATNQSTITRTRAASRDPIFFEIDTLRRLQPGIHFHAHFPPSRYYQYKTIELPLVDYEKWLKTEAHKQLETLIMEEQHGKSRYEAKLETELPEDVPAKKPTILDALIAQEATQTVHSILESPKYTSKIEAYIRTVRELFEEHPDLPERDLLILICDRLKINPVNVRQIKSRARKIKNRIKQK